MTQHNLPVSQEARQWAAKFVIECNAGGLAAGHDKAYLTGKGDDSVLVKIIQRAIAQADSAGYRRAVEEAAGKLGEWIGDTGEMLLSCGEMTATEVRLAKAILKQRQSAIRALAEPKG